MVNARIAFALSLFLSSTAAPAFAQDPIGQTSSRLPPSQVGKILKIEGPPGSIIVVRGAQAYALQAGDALFRGDRIVARSNGSVILSADDCERRLEPTTSVVVDGNICDAEPVTLADADSLIRTVAAGSAVGIGATPLLFPGIAALGAAASALTGSDASASEVHQTPSQPEN